MSDVIEGEIVDEETRHLPAVRAHEAMVTRAEVGVDDVLEQREKIKQVMERVMTAEVHYGRIPGIQKPTLFKAGAEVLNTTFRLAPSYTSERIFGDEGHLTVIAKCVLTHAPSGMVLGEGEGLCSSREAKYAYRNAKRTCPGCGAEAIIKGKDEYGGGWLCWKKQDGCGAKFPDGDERIEGQDAGKVANPELPDTWNTVLKMADKRALVAAVLNCTAASDIFSQDAEDLATAAPVEEETRAPDPHGFNESRADHVEQPPNDTDPLAVRVHFGKNANQRLADLSQRQREWYAGDGWAERKTGAVSDQDRRLRRAARRSVALEPFEQTGPFQDEPF